MPEPLSTGLVAEELAKLHLAFPYHAGMTKDPTATTNVYRNGLNGLSGDAVRVAVVRAIQSGDGFPKVSQLREYATEWARRQAVEVFERDPMFCPHCQTRVVVRDRYRPLLDASGRPRLTRAGWLLLEFYQRALCECAAPCAYWPAPDREPLQMPSEAAPRDVIRRAMREL